MAMKQFFYLITAFILFFQSSAVRWEVCKRPEKHSGTVSNVLVTGCEGKTPCELHKGKNYTIEVDFTSGVESKKLTAVVHGVIAGTSIPFPLSNPDGCKESGIVCPVAPKKSYKYKSTIPVLKFYPSVTLAVEWELKDAKGDVFCIELPAQIVP